MTFLTTAAHKLFTSICKLFNLICCYLFVIILTNSETEIKWKCTLQYTVLKSSLSSSRFLSCSNHLTNHLISTHIQLLLQTFYHKIICDNSSHHSFITATRAFILKTNYFNRSKNLSLFYSFIDSFRLFYFHLHFTVCVFFCCVYFFLNVSDPSFLLLNYSLTVNPFSNMDHVHYSTKRLALYII